ncbi:MAG: sigma-54-dependent Fis family transcriptional regulator [Bacteroidia bacterium]|nr:sigma-54-dependent Fis family transcriptional regulator [Bacteroidota bacterium]MBK8876555.1 sigma-54-dependent Fis family transcriptional regulator [Bacteroidota bacterium]MBP9081715.1 sigma-54-dependent Fis family transcriptional regulator [Bacteroidia bacterium]
MAKIFIIEDDVMVATLMKQALGKYDHELTHFTNAEDCLQNLHLNPDIVTVDYNLPGMNGIDLMGRIKSYNSAIMVVLVSGQETLEVVVAAYKGGASEYIIKNDSLFVNLENSIRNLSMNVVLKREVEFLKDQIIDRHKYSNILGNSNPVIRVLKLIQKVEKSNIMVLVTGQSGTGKELVAKALHYNSPRNRKPFVTVNMGAIPEDLIESELFGHEKGAFTDARERRIGKFEEANEGTIFLDEIGEMNLHLQTKLLRVLQEKEITRIGSNKIIKLDFRMIAATNRNLATEVKEGRFREDLFYRIQGFLIHLPPLKERGDDVILLAKSFLTEFCKNNKMDQVQLSKEAAKFMLEYEWPGNIRELKAVMERAALLCENSTIQIEDLMFVQA